MLLVLLVLPVDEDCPVFVELVVVLVMLVLLFTSGNALWFTVMVTAVDSDGTMKNTPNPIPETNINASMVYITALRCFTFISFFGLV